MLTRRTFAKLSALAGAGAIAGWSAFTAGASTLPGRAGGQQVGVAALAMKITPTVTPFVDALPIPPRIDMKAGGTLPLAMAPAQHQFHKSLGLARTWGYGGATYLGPTIEAMRGKPIAVQATNNLGAHPLASTIDTGLHGALATDATRPRAAVHLHGGNTEPKSDGYPEDTFLPGTSRTYSYNNNQEAANIWYHDHALGITRLNVYAGLAGSYLLRDSVDTGQPGNPLGLPAPYGTYEIPLVIQDKMLNADGTLAYPLGMTQPWSPEFFGDVPVVNGKVWPYLNVDRGLYRFRIINGSNARFYNLRLQSQGVRVFQIGAEGGLLNAPVPITTLLIAPGERADILVDFSQVNAGTNLILTNDAVAPYPSGSPSVRRGGVPIGQIMQFRVGAKLGLPAKIPATLRAAPIAPLPAPVRVRNLALVEILDPATGMPMMVLLNNLPWMAKQVEQPKVDTVEQWNIINLTADTHPVHLHLVQFQVLNRQAFDVGGYLQAFNKGLPAPGVPNPAAAMLGPWPAPAADPFLKSKAVAPDPNERGWKDTVRANPGQVTRLMVPFGAKAAAGIPFGNSFTGRYVWHCHILEHEDNEMMLPYDVVR